MGFKEDVGKSRIVFRTVVRIEERQRVWGTV